MKNIYSSGRHLFENVHSCQIRFAFLLTSVSLASSSASIFARTRIAVEFVHLSSIVEDPRPRWPWAFAISPSIYVDGIELQRLRNGTFFVASLPIGEHMITAGRSEVGLFVDFEPDAQYYFRMDHKNWAGTAVSGRQPVFLSQVPADQAEAEMKNLKALKVK
jgi:hypothetical protein